MSWHRTPTDDAWKQAHLAMVEGLGKRLWLGCDGCQHTVMIAPRELADPPRPRHADATADALAGAPVHALRGAEGSKPGSSCTAILTDHGCRIVCDKAVAL